MPYLLRFDGTNDRVDIPALTLPSSFEIEIDITYYTATSDRFLFSGFTAGNAGRWYVGTFNNAVWWRLGSGFSAATSTTLVDGARYKIKLIRSGDNFTLQVDGVTIATRTQAFTMQALSRIGSSQDPLYFAKIDLFYLSYTDTATPANNRYYDPSGTSSGTTLFDTVGSNDGTLVNFTVPACWVFYSSGATAYADTLLAGSYAHSGSLLNSSAGYSSALQAGSFAHSGSVLSSAVARNSTLLAGSYTHSGSALGSAVGYSSTLQGGAFSYSGSELQSIIQNGAQNYSDTLLGGSFTHSGSALQSSVARNSTLLAGSYSHSGSSLSASLAFYSTLNGGSYSHFGSMLQSTVSGQVTVSIEGYTITFAADDVSGAFAADMVGGSYQSDYIEAIKWLT